MAGILIIAHTPVATAMLDFIQHIYGELPEHIMAVDIPAHEDIKVSTQRVSLAAANVVDAKEVLILTDILGATPCNVASKVALADKENTMNVLTGLNLPMLLRAVSHRHEPLSQLIEISLQGGVQGVVRIRSASVETIL